MQSRLRVIQATPPKRRLNVAMDEQDGPNISHPVKINHVKQNPVPAATLPAP